MILTFSSERQPLLPHLELLLKLTVRQFEQTLVNIVANYAIILLPLECLMSERALSSKHKVASSSSTPDANFFFLF